MTGFNLPAGLKVKAAGRGQRRSRRAARCQNVSRAQAAQGGGRQPARIARSRAERRAGRRPRRWPCPARSAGGSQPHGGGDNDYFRFESKAGQTWIVETDAARRGSPVDTVIEVLTADGKPIERVLLQAVRDSNITFRGIDGNTRDCRLTNWEEMQLNQLVYLNGEVVKLFRSPRGPDSGFLFYEGDGGKRLCYFDTTATVHAVDEPCFIVEPHPPRHETGLQRPAGDFRSTTPTTTTASGGLGSDSRLTFTAPADGSVPGSRARRARRRRRSVRLSADASARRSPTSTSRWPAPVPRSRPAAASGSRWRSIASTASTAKCRSTLAGLARGLSRVDAARDPGRPSRGRGRDAGRGRRQAAHGRGAGQDRRCRPRPRSTASEVTKPVNSFGKIKLGRQTQAAGAPGAGRDLVVAPGTTVSAMLKVERNGHDDLITFSVDNLPHGVIVDNIGLSGVLMPKGESERQIFITADAWVPETSRLCFAVENQAGNQCSPPVTVHVRRASPLANAGK